MAAVARETGFLREVEWRGFVRFLGMLDDLIAILHGSENVSLMERVEIEVRDGGLVFPSTEVIVAAGLEKELRRYGGRRALGARLGFCREGKLFMGAFSISFAAEIMRFAVESAQVSPEGYLAMPGEEEMLEYGRGELYAMCGRFGGGKEVGRRLGLVPRTGMLDPWEVNVDVNDVSGE